MKKFLAFSAGSVVGAVTATTVITSVLYSLGKALKNGKYHEHPVAKAMAWAQAAMESDLFDPDKVPWEEMN